MTDRVFLKHKETGGTTEVPNDPDVLADFADRGWLPAEKSAVADFFIPHPSGHGAKALPDDFFGPPARPVKDNEQAEKSATTGKGE